MKSLPAGLILTTSDNTIILTLGNDTVVLLYSENFESTEIQCLIPRGSNDWFLTRFENSYYGELITRDWNNHISIRSSSLYDSDYYDDDYDWDWSWEEYYLNRYQDYKY